MDPCLQEGPQDQALLLGRRPAQMGLSKAQLMEKNTLSLIQVSLETQKPPAPKLLSPHASSSPPSLPLPTPLYKVRPLRLLRTFLRPFNPQDSQPLRTFSQSLPLTQRIHLFLPSLPIGLSQASTSSLIFLSL